MSLVSSRLPAMDDGDRVWFAMLDDGKPVDCYVDTDVLDSLDEPAFTTLARFDRYRPVFELMVNDLYRRRQELVLQLESVSRWEI